MTFQQIFFDKKNFNNIRDNICTALNITNKDSIKKCSKLLLSEMESVYNTNKNDIDQTKPKHIVKFCDKLNKLCYQSTLNKFKTKMNNNYQESFNTNSQMYASVGESGKCIAADGSYINEFVNINELNIEKSVPDIENIKQSRDSEIALIYNQPQNINTNPPWNHFTNSKKQSSQQKLIKQYQLQITQMKQQMNQMQNEILTLNKLKTEQPSNTIDLQQLIHKIKNLPTIPPSIENNIQIIDPYKIVPKKKITFKDELIIEIDSNDYTTPEFSNNYIIDLTKFNIQNFTKLELLDCNFPFVFTANEDCNNFKINNNDIELDNISYTLTEIINLINDGLHLNDFNIIIKESNNKIIFESNSLFSLDFSNSKLGLYFGFTESNYNNKTSYTSEKTHCFLKNTIYLFIDNISKTNSISISNNKILNQLPTKITSNLQQLIVKLCMSNKLDDNNLINFIDSHKLKFLIHL